MDVNLQVQVHPSRSNNVRKAVLRELSSLLLRTWFNEKFQGVVLAYEFNIDKTKSKVVTFFSKARYAFSVDEETLCISGSLLPAHTGSILWLDKHVENVSLTDGSNKRRRGNEEESVMQEPSRTSAEAYSIVDHYIKKSKKHRESATQKPSRSEAYSAISDHSIKKSKKHRESAMQEPSRSEAYSAISDNSIKKSKKHKTREES
ncbi:DNA-directed RNA polymerase [Prunus dulcis]|uniref:DNA-directed RNA polymerase n=1 Tax=Prunus dulcis TaxID=3755 RepID=A0A4Y1S1S7_PRUDU|nr:DNA-directed RNA polymerase [Prunus dulcis]